RKGLEAWFTGLIESIWGKERIMEVYLNVAEMGKGAFGVQAIADRAFQREAIKLSRSQCARIAACLPSPRRYDAAAPSAYVSRRADWVLRQMNNLGDIFPTKEP
ncbi:MAG: transglycosylase domain-containing protein, partial [Flavobacteriales bacterium]|nr:transglycosylase domain-containing protein [Flavobacteriales bacterium]